MPRIKLSGTLSITSELFSRLKARGLLSSSGECSDNFVIYLQECLARDDARVQGPCIFPTESLLKPQEPLVKEKSIESVQTQNNLNINTIRKRAEALYAAK